MVLLVILSFYSRLITYLLLLSKNQTKSLKTKYFVCFQDAFRAGRQFAKTFDESMTTMEESHRQDINQSISAELKKHSKETLMDKLDVSKKQSPTQVSNRLGAVM